MVGQHRSRAVCIHPHINLTHGDGATGFDPCVCAVGLNDCTVRHGEAAASRFQIHRTGRGADVARCSQAHRPAADDADIAAACIEGCIEVQSTRHAKQNVAAARRRDGVADDAVATGKQHDGAVASNDHAAQGAGVVLMGRRAQAVYAVDPRRRSRHATHGECIAFFDKRAAAGDAQSQGIDHAVKQIAARANVSGADAQAQAGGRDVGNGRGFVAALSVQNTAAGGDADVACTCRNDAHRGAACLAFEADVAAIGLELGIGFHADGRTGLNVNGFSAGAGFNLGLVVGRVAVGHQHTGHPHQGDVAVAGRDVVGNGQIACALGLQQDVAGGTGGDDRPCHAHGAIGGDHHHVAAGTCQADGVQGQGRGFTNVEAATGDVGGRNGERAGVQRRSTGTNAGCRAEGQRRRIAINIVTRAREVVGDIARCCREVDRAIGFDDADTDVAGVGQHRYYAAIAGVERRGFLAIGHADRRVGPNVDQPAGGSQVAAYHHTSGAGEHSDCATCGGDGAVLRTTTSACIVRIGDGTRCCQRDVARRAADHVVHHDLLGAALCGQRDVSRPGIHHACA